MKYFFLNKTATPEVSTLSLSGALPISHRRGRPRPLLAGAVRPPVPPLRALAARRRRARAAEPLRFRPRGDPVRSEEHTSELQSRQYLVCRLLLEKKNIITL